MKKNETNFLDRIEYRLSLNGRVWAEWFAYGDGFPEVTVSADSLDIVSQSPLFSTVQVGGFAKSLEHRVTSVRSEVDPVVTILVAHLCATEFNVHTIKAQIKINTPEEPPFVHSLSWGMPKSLSRELPSSLCHVLSDGDRENCSQHENLLPKPPSVRLFDSPVRQR